MKPWVRSSRWSAWSQEVPRGGHGVRTVECDRCGPGTRAGREASTCSHAGPAALRPCGAHGSRRARARIASTVRSASRAPFAQSCSRAVTRSSRYARRRGRGLQRCGSGDVVAGQEEVRRPAPRLRLRVHSIPRASSSGPQADSEPLRAQNDRVLPPRLLWCDPRPIPQFDPQEPVTLIVRDPGFHEPADEDDCTTFSYFCQTHDRFYGRETCGEGPHLVALHCEEHGPESMWPQPLSLMFPKGFEPSLSKAQLSWLQAEWEDA